MRERRGPSYLVPPGLDVPTEVVATSHDLDIGDLRGAMPEHDSALRAPFAVAWRDGEVAAVCETARDGSQSVEADVWTYPAYRRQGLAGAVVRAWASIVTTRTAFYSTSDDNHASIGVAHSLGLVPIGHWWIVEPD